MPLTIETSGARSSASRICGMADRPKQGVEERSESVCKKFLGQKIVQQVIEGI